MDLIWWFKWSANYFRSFPRTSETKYGPNPHDCKVGYTGDLKRTELLIEETNEQGKGDTLQCTKGGHNKSNRTFRQ